MSDHERRRSFRPRCETLGDRILPAASPTVQLIQGVLLVSGTESADVIDVRVTPYRTPRGAIPVVQVAGVRGMFPATRFQMVVVDARGGDDFVRVNDGGRPLLSAWIDGGDGNDTLFGGSSVDRIIGGPGDDVIFGRGGADAIDGGPGQDVIDGVADPAPVTPAPPAASPPTGTPSTPTSTPPPASEAPTASPSPTPETPNPTPSPASDSPATSPVATSPPSGGLVPAPSINPGPATPAEIDEAEQAIVERTNQARAEAGLAPLAVDPQLQRAATIQADNMAMLNRMAHDLPETSTPTLTDRAKAVGYRYSRLGENIAFNYFTPSQAIDGWLASEGHRRNILTAEFTQIGVAIAYSAKGKPYYVQVFGRPIA